VASLSLYSEPVDLLTALRSKMSTVICLTRRYLESADLGYT
jgi:hypothetical protein